MTNFQFSILNFQYLPSGFYPGGDHPAIVQGLNLGLRACSPQRCLCLAWIALLLAFSPTSAPAQSIYEPYTFTTLAGLAGTAGNKDGTGSAARLYNPSGVAVDSAGNLYVADYGNELIRKVTPAGVVTTLAGLAGQWGSADGPGNNARFHGPSALALDGAGNVYVADQLNSTIRRMTSSGVVTTVAGLAGSSGSADGTGSAARFLNPSGVAVDSEGNIFVADGGNYTVRKVTPTGVVTTLAGLAGSWGSQDGTGSEARFSPLAGVGVDNAGNVYVADSRNNTIRKVTPAGVVTTLAGWAGKLGSTDGTGNAARFNGPAGVALDGAGNVYVADNGNYTIRKITPAALVTTLAGLANSYGSLDGTGKDARFNGPMGVAVDSVGNLYVADADNDTIRQGSATHLRAPTITLSPVSQTVLVGSNVTFLVLAIGAPLNYQWLFNGTPIPGQTNASLLLPNVQTAQSGLYTVTVSNALGATTSPAASLAVVQQLPVEARFRAALAPGGTVRWEEDGLIAITQTIQITNDTVLDATGHAVTISGQNSLRLFQVSSNVHLTLLNITLASGLADQGGALYNDGGIIALSDCWFTANQAIGSDTNELAAAGGAIYSIGGIIAAINCVFAANSAMRGHVIGTGPPDYWPYADARLTPSLQGRGGAIVILDGVLKLVNCQFTTNQVAGGLFTTPLLTSFTSFKGGAFGGAVFLANSPAEVTGCRFDHNLAQSPLLKPSQTGGLDNRDDILGGALHQEGTGLLHLEDCVLGGNQTLGGGAGRDGRSGDGRGGAVSSYGNLVADNCSFQGNSCVGGGSGSLSGGNAFGGALFTTNTAILNQCLFSQNSALGGGGRVTNGYSGGGAVYAQGKLQILNTTFASNGAGVGSGVPIYLPVSPMPNPGSSAGGALFSGAVCVASNSTWYQNQAKVDAYYQHLTLDYLVGSEGAVAGAAIYQSSNSLTLAYCTIANNAIVSATNTGAAIALATNAIAQLSACLLSGNTQGNLAGNIVDEGFNLSSDHSVLFTNATSRNDIDPKLGDFGDHGGLTPTVALLPGSPAIDAITSGPCPATDQRGVPRPIGAGCDIGAFEFGFVPAPILSLDPSGTFRVQVVLLPTRDYQIDVSTNLSDWTFFSTNRSDDLGNLSFTDTTATNAPYRFYRVTPKE